MTKVFKEKSSFRDPSGFIFFHDNGEIYRQVNKLYQENYQLLFSSGLYERLTKKRKLVSHIEVDITSTEPDELYKIIKPEKIDFISYPYEWSFTQLKDAALLTLNIQKESLLSDMILKDASAYNIQFLDGHPILIDTLSFTKYNEGDVWIGYKQFCQHFLSPLALMSLKDIQLSEILKNHIDGIPLDLTSKLLPGSSWFRFGILTHIHLHARAQKRFISEQTTKIKPKGQISKIALIGMIENLEKTINNLHWSPHGTDWLKYYQFTNYSEPAMEMKKDIIKEILHDLNPKTLIDLGANNGVFSRLGKDIDDCYIVSTDIDPGAVELNYLEVKNKREKHLLPLIIDLTNPSPALGWDNHERSSFSARINADVVMALALIHHLAISNNLPFSKIAQYFSRMSKYLIIEFVPKDDSQVERLLATRDDIFSGYTVEKFLNAMNEFYTLVQRIPIPETKREIFLFENKFPMND